MLYRVTNKRCASLVEYVKVKWWYNSLWIALVQKSGHKLEFVSDGL